MTNNEVKVVFAANGKTFNDILKLILISKVR